MKTRTIKLFIFLLANTIISQVGSAQINLKDCFIHFEMMKSASFSLIDLKTGKVHYTTTLKQAPFYVKMNENSKLIFAQARNFAYKINAETGEILTEFEFEPIKEQKKTDYMDPNMYLLPFELSETGIGFYSDMNDQMQGKTKGIIIYSFDIEKKTKKQFANLDKYVNGSLLVDNRLFFVEEQPYLNSGWSTNSDKSFKLVETPLDNFNPKKVSIPTNFTDGKTSVAHENLKTIMLDDLTNNILNIKFTLSDDPTPITPKMHFYAYDLKANKGIQISDANFLSVNNKKQFLVNLKCPDKNPMPSAPETFVPTGYNRKQMAEAEKINADRLAAYQKELDTWLKETMDNSGCECKLSEFVNGFFQEIGTFEGTNYLRIYHDTYVLYFDGLEYHMYDMKQKKKIWSNSF
jgi:hypothetical protein